MTSSEKIRYISFSGGGWSSHTASSAWISGALQALRNKKKSEDVDFDDLLGGLHGAAGNSGGSWFLSMLAYSEEFKEGLNNVNGSADWFSTGYMGQVKDQFGRADDDNGKQQMINDLSSEIIESILMTSSKFSDLSENFKKLLIEYLSAKIKPYVSDAVELLHNDYYVNIASLGSKELKPDWSEVTKNLVYSPYDMKDQLNRPLGENPNEWAAGKDIIISAAMPTKDVIVTGKTFEIDNFLSSSSFTENFNLPEESFASPVTIELNGGSADTSWLKFLAGDHQLSYLQSDTSWDEKASRKESIETFLDSSLSIIDAATISSSAAGMLTSVDFVKQALRTKLDEVDFLKDIDLGLDSDAIGKLSDLLSPYLARYLDGLSIPLSLSNSEASAEIPARDASLQSIAESQSYRLVDGGYVDNTAVANIVSSMQDEYSNEQEFSIALFSNSTGGDKTIPNSHLNLTEDVALLFGDPKEGSAKTWDKGTGYGFTIKTVSPHIFDIKAWKNVDAPAWSYTSEKYGEGKEKRLQYYRLDVETISNDAFNIEAGYKGELHVFVNVDKQSNAAPVDLSMFNVYSEMFGTTQDAILKGDLIHGPGADFLLNALGLNLENKGSYQASLLKGVSNDDYISGSDGNDILIGNHKKNKLTGGRGSDIFKYQTISDSRAGEESRDLITDFSSREEDKIDLSMIDADLSFIGSDEFSGKNGEVRFYNGMLIVNIKGASDPEMEIQLEAVNTFNPEHLIL